MNSRLIIQYMILVLIIYGISCKQVLVVLRFVILFTRGSLKV